MKTEYDTIAKTYRLPINTSLFHDAIPSFERESSGVLAQESLP